MKTPWALLAFEGRTRRLPFLFTMIAVSLLFYSVRLRLLVDGAIHSVDPTYPLENIPLAREAPSMANGVAIAVLVMAALLACGLVWASVAALARRFHDMGLSGWIAVPAVAVARLVPDIADTAYLPPLGFLLLIAILALVPGTPGSNRFDAAALPHE